MAVQTNTAMFWFRFLQTGYGPTGYGQPARPGRILVLVLTDRLRPARPTRPCFSRVPTDRLRPALPTWPYYGTGFYRPVTAGPPAPAVIWFLFLQTGYGRPARPGRALVRFLSHPAVLWYRFLQTGYGRPAQPAVFRYRFLQTGYGRPARPGRALTGYGRPARPGRISVPVLTAVFRYWFLQPGYGRPARPGRALVRFLPNPAVLWYRFLQNGYGRPARPGRISVIVLADRLRPARPTRPYFGNCFCRPVTAGPPDPAVFRYRFLQTGYGRVTAVSSGPGRVGSETGTLVTYVNGFDPSSYPNKCGAL
ncbi:hypothetical protein BC829DRAFT_424184 [Chytridium lagenaria]|nr:hypothetical protein BC829DRAFT_424184 [Chytridium lagenaria]